MIVSLAHMTAAVLSSSTIPQKICSPGCCHAGFADDYALLINGLLDLYSAGGGLEWLQWAIQVQATMDTLFWDSKQGGYFATTTTDKSIKLRMKERYVGLSSCFILQAQIYPLHEAATIPCSDHEWREVFTHLCQHSPTWFLL